MHKPSAQNMFIFFEILIIFFLEFLIQEGFFNSQVIIWVHLNKKNLNYLIKKKRSILNDRIFISNRKVKIIIYYRYTTKIV